MRIQKTQPNAIIPTRGSQNAAGYDLFALIPEEVKLVPPHKMEKIHTGIAVEIPDGYVGLIFPRSGLSTKEGLRLANSTGVIDSDYRGELIVAIYNDNLYKTKTVTNGQRIAQLVIVPCFNEKIDVVDNLSTTTRGVNGFGSSGK